MEEEARKSEQLHRFLPPPVVLEMIASKGREIQRGVRQIVGTVVFADIRHPCAAILTSLSHLHAKARAPPPHARLQRLHAALRAHGAAGRRGDPQRVL